MMKTILLIVSKDIIRRNILETSFWDDFIRHNSDNKIVLVIEKGKVDLYTHLFSRENVEIQEFDRNQGLTKLQKVIYFFVRNAIHSDSIRLFRKRAALSNQAGWLQTVVKGFLVNTFGRFDWYRQLLRRILLRTRATAQVEKIFAEYKPDFVIALSLIDADFDVALSLEAKRQNKTLLGMVRSWDNLNNHGLLAVVPDVFAFQNTFLQECATKFQAIDLNTILHDLVGLPHYDLYHNPEKVLMTREEFFTSMNLDPDKKLLLYGGSDVFLDEVDMPQIFSDLITQKKITEPVQVVYRPHPSTPVDLAQVEKLPGIIMDNVFTSETFAKKTAIEFDTYKFINLLYYTDVLINTGSTLSIDAAVFDRPAICINFDGNNSRQYWNSVTRLYDSWDHYQRLVECGGVQYPESIEELADSINDYLSDSNLDSEGRKKIVSEFVHSFDGDAGKRLAQLFTEHINRDTLER